MPQLIQMEGQRGIRDIEFRGNVAGCHAFRSRTNEQAKNRQAAVMGEGRQGGDGVFGFHISRIIEIYGWAKQQTQVGSSRSLIMLLRCETLATVRCMDRKITQRQLRNDSAAVLREVQAGQTVIVTRNGEPVAELRPLPGRRFVPRSAIADAARRATRVNADRLKADLDAVVDQSAHG